MTQQSSGAVVFHRNGNLGPSQEVNYLLLLSTYWGFPKGMIEPGEDEQSAALREVREETGLSVVLIQGFRQVDDYWYQRKGQRIRKQAIYFLAQAPNRQVKISWEHEDWAWLTYESAIERLAFVSLQQTLTAANDFLRKKGSVI